MEPAEAMVPPVRLREGGGAERAVDGEGAGEVGVRGRRSP